MPKIRKLSEEEEEAKSKVLREIGARIKKARSLVGLDQYELARQMQVTNAAVSAWEAGQIDIPATKLIKLSQLLGVRVGWIFGEGAENNKSPIILKNGIAIIDVPISEPSIETQFEAAKNLLRRLLNSSETVDVNSAVSDDEP